MTEERHEDGTPPFQNQAEYKTPKPEKDKSFGPVIGIIIIIIILALGGFYFWGQRLVKEGILNEDEKTQEKYDQALESLRQLSDSDDVSAIEEDLNATDLSPLDKNLGNINAALEDINKN